VCPFAASKREKGKHSFDDDDKDQKQPLRIANHQISSFIKFTEARDLFRTKAFFNGLLEQRLRYVECNAASFFAA